MAALAFIPCPVIRYRQKAKVIAMKKRLAALLLLCCLLPLGARGEELPAYSVTQRKTHTVYDTETLKYTIEKCTLVNHPTSTGKAVKTACYVTKVWVREPARQIKKAISPWHEAIWKAENIAKQIDGAALVINGSGYVSERYPEIPENYPGVSEDYYCTPLGSIAVVDGEVKRNLEGVPYYGLTLEEDGLHMYVGADNEAVLARHPLQTWSFYEGCPMALNGEDILDHDWAFARRRAIRTVIAKLTEENTYLILTTGDTGLTLLEANAFLLGEYDTAWIYDLDGGPSSALMRRLQGKKTLKVLHPAKQRIVDVMGFIE